MERLEKLARRRDRSVHHLVVEETVHFLEREKEKKC